MGESFWCAWNTIDFYLRMRYDIDNVLGMGRNPIPSRFCHFMEHFIPYCVEAYR